MFGLASQALHHEMHNPVPKKPDRCTSGGGFISLLINSPK
jgi:hypothetical protein